MDSDIEIIEGSVEYIKYVNELNGYTVMEFDCGGELIPVVGKFPNLNEGESLRLKGRFSVHTEYGEQFNALEYEYIAPVDGEALIKYLASGVFEGIGPVTAQRIVEKFGAETLSVIAQTPEKLSSVRGISAEKAKNIGKTYSENFAYGQIMLYLQKFDIGNALASKIYKNYGQDTINIIEKDPYRMAEEIKGIGFKTVDLIAKKTGANFDEESRIRAAILYILGLASQNGHAFLPKERLYGELESLLGTDREGFPDALLKLSLTGGIRVDEESNIYLSNMYKYETYIADKLNVLAETPSKSVITDFDKRIENFQKTEGISLAENQVFAISRALANNVTVITGGPGTGKTTIIKCIINIFGEEGYKVVIAAPTGRAAKRITEATGYEASTVHRLLELVYSEDEELAKFGRNAGNPLDADVIIIDEASMLDMSITYSLLEAMKNSSRLILCGDADQLPSVGAGNILKDIIESGKIQTVKLTEIYRQAAESLIITNAHKINTGVTPSVNEKGGDFYMISEENPSKIAGIIADLCSERLPQKYGYDPFTDIQVLTPMRKGICGVESLNAMLQNRLNPPSKLRSERNVKNVIFREGDKIMQIKNNYGLRWERIYNAKEEGEGLYNGDMGIVAHIDNELRYMDVEYDEERLARYDFNQFEEVEHAFAVTIHKSQGSEFPAVVIPVCFGPKLLMTRNLIYTAITRAKNLVVLVGSKNALCRMIDNTSETKRYTGLRRRL